MSTQLRRTAIFQALVKGKDNGGAYLITFPAPQVADEWYRKIIDSAAANLEPVKRISPQYYIYDAAAMPNGEGIQQSTKEFVVAGPLRMDQPTIYPALRYTNHVSGNWFAIRSPDDPGPMTLLMETSRTKRTYFQIWIVEPVKSDGTIMIGSDQVRMSVFHDRNNPLGRVNDGELQFLNTGVANGRVVLQFSFSELGTGFGSSGYQGDRVFFDPGAGEGWELI